MNIFNKEKKMVIIITRTKNNDGSYSTKRERIGDNLENEEKRFVVSEIERNLFKSSKS